MFCKRSIRIFSIHSNHRRMMLDNVCRHRNFIVIGCDSDSTTFSYKYLSSLQGSVCRPSRRRRSLGGGVAIPNDIVSPQSSSTSKLRSVYHFGTWSDIRWLTTDASPPSTSPTATDTMKTTAITDIAATAASDVREVIDGQGVTTSQEVNEMNPKETFEKLLYDDEAFVEAYKFITTTETIPHDENQHYNDWKQNSYVQLFDAMIGLHRKLVDTYSRSFPSLMNSSIYTTASNNLEISSDQIQTLQQMIQMADMANNILALMEPFLGARTTLFFKDETLGVYDNDTTDEMETSTMNDKRRIGDKVDLQDYINTSNASSTLPQPTSTKQRRKRNEIDLDLTMRCDDVLTAWAQTIHAGYRGKVLRSYIRAIPQRAQFLLRRMEITVEDEDYSGPQIPPSLSSYNSVLQAWAFSREHLRASSAQLIFDKLTSKRHGTAYSNIRPDGDSYRNIIWAWSLSRERRAAFNASGHLIKILNRLELGFDDDALYEGTAIEPTIEDYHIVAKAWIQSEEKNSAGRAQSLLKLMDRMYKKGVTMLQPDMMCYKSVFLAAAKRPDLPDLGPLMDETLTMMRDRFIVPDAECYSAAIKTWKNAAIYQIEVTVVNQQTSVRRAIELLAEMDVAHNRSTLVSISVSTENINDVLEALTVSSHPTRTTMVDELLDKLLRRNDDGSSANMYATAESFIYALRVWRTIESMEKIAKGKAILWRVKDYYPELVRQHKNKSADRRKDQIVDIFNEFVQLCGSYQPQSNKDGLQVLGEALDAIRVMRSMDTTGTGLYHTLIPNASTFASLLLAVTNLLSQGSPERRISVENIFTMCCTDGMLDDNVLNCFRDAATSNQFATMVEAHSEVVEGMKVVPESWTTNALGGKVNSADGRKTVPLGIDGLLKRTTAMNDFQMRRLVDHRNRLLLRGGRWRSQSKYNDNPHAKNSRPWKLYDATLMENSPPVPSLVTVAQI